MYFNHPSLLLTALVYSRPDPVASEIDQIFKKQNSTKTHNSHEQCSYFLQRDALSIQEMQVGKSYEKNNPPSNYSVSNELGETSAKCIGGFAGGYPCDSVDLLSMMDNRKLSTSLPGSPRKAKLNDIWGWTHSGREFALVGLNEGVAFVEITDPVRPVHLGSLRSATSKAIQRDIKTIGNYAVIVSEAKNHGLQIFDLMELTTSKGHTKFKATARFTGFGSSHNVFAHEDTGFVYAVGSDKCGGGLYVVDMNDPLKPRSAGCFLNNRYTHDVQCVIYKGPDTSYRGKQICFALNGDTITIVDVTNKDNMVQLSESTYNDYYYMNKYAHQGWLTEDHSYFIFNDELDEAYGYASNTRTHVMSVSDLNKPYYAGYHNGRTTSIDHNLYVIDDYVYQANYRAGLNVLKINDIAESKFEEAGYFDIDPTSDIPAFNGAWSNYPFFPSGVIVMSGIEQGLFVLKFNASPVSSSDSDDVNSSDSDDTDECGDGDYFYHKNLKSCSWLVDKSPKTLRKYCNNLWRYKEVGGDMYGPPHVECPMICHACNECNESEKYKFFLEQNKHNKPKLQSCKWLKKQKNRHIICSKKATDGVYPSADVVCPQTCNLVNDCN